MNEISLTKLPPKWICEMTVREGAKIRIIPSTEATSGLHIELSSMMRGEKGDKGDKGDRGERGEKGEAGETFSWSTINW